MLCNDCRSQHSANPIRLDVRIGDFGLVSVADPEAETVPDAKAVGTELYRPASAQAHSPSLDIYALGIITFELLWKFETRMERLHTIQQLKQGAFPQDFSKKLGKQRAGAVKECIEAMLAHNGDGISIHELKQRLSAIQSSQ